jgi:hypothetical protein
LTLLYQSIKEIRAAECRLQCYAGYCKLELRADARETSITHFNHFNTQDNSSATSVPDQSRYRGSSKGRVVQQGLLGEKIPKDFDGDASGLFILLRYAGGASNGRIYVIILAPGVNQYDCPHNTRTIRS